jgi:hypothetical protein
MKEIDWETSLSSQAGFDKLLDKIKVEVPWYETIYYKVRYTITDFLYEVKMKYQILTRGYSDRNWYGMCDDIAALNIKLLTALRDNGNGYPNGLTEKKWKAILTKMIEGFDAHLLQSGYFRFDIKSYKKAEKKFKDGMELYVKYYHNLWD